MSGRVLIVDDNPINLRLLEARLSAEYFDIVSATSGEDALRLCQSESFDLVLSDVMMPRMDGFELCARIKSDPQTQHLPVVLITALDHPSDRVRGLEAGADDFLTKPVRDLPLFSRVRSLTRLKQMTDELRRRAETASELIVSDNPDGRGSLHRHRILTFSERREEAQRIGFMIDEIAITATASDPDEALNDLREGGVSLAIIDLVHRDRGDPLRFLARARSDERLRSLPIVAITPTEDDATAARALELGAHDYVQRPIDRNELVARIRTQLARQRYSENLRKTVERTLELAVIDGLTGLHNRRFLDAHLDRAVKQASRRNGSFAVLLADLDHFKSINDRFGHDVGDAVLREFSRRLETSIRASDLACRVGGEEFAVLMPNADIRMAIAGAERVRETISTCPVVLPDGQSLDVTLSAGVAVFPDDGESPLTLMRRADEALYRAKHAGRNRVEPNMGDHPSSLTKSSNLQSN
ncbi:MAG: PleD family two-component system response regulator [Pseudomonadota bacterium]|nr:PleD family two-component system response regulator [Pseudomonadota bacterium]